MRNLYKMTVINFIANLKNSFYDNTEELSKAIEENYGSLGDYEEDTYTICPICEITENSRDTFWAHNYGDSFFTCEKCCVFHCGDAKVTKIDDKTVEGYIEIIQVKYYIDSCFDERLPLPDYEKLSDEYEEMRTDMSISFVPVKSLDLTEVLGKDYETEVIGEFLVENSSGVLEMVFGHGD